MFLDASAIVGIINNEYDSDVLIETLETAEGPRLYSGISAYEAIAGLARAMTTARDGRNAPVLLATLEHAERLVTQFFEEVGATEVAINASVTRIALEAARSFGKILAQPADLNMGDCFAYACARVYRVPLLSKGNDFPQTDIERA